MEDKKTKNSPAKIRANNKYKAKTYKRLAIDIRPEIDAEIRETAKAEGLSIAGYLVSLHKKHLDEKKESKDEL